MRSARACPAAVSSTRRLERERSFTPRADSSWATWRLSAGWATPYPLPLPFTNSGTFTPLYGAKTRIGIQNVQDLQRYFRLAITSTTTNIVTASFDGHRR